MAVCANLIASTSSSSCISFDSPSTMLTSCSEPATINSRVAVCNWLKVGLITNLPSTLATRTSDIGPLNGISEQDNAADAAKPAKQSGMISLSADINDIITCVSA